MTAAASAVMAGSLTLSAEALLWGAASDVSRYIIPNAVPALVTVAFGVMACFMPPAFAIGGLLTGVAILAVGAMVFARGWMGGGDVKLLAAAGLWAGPMLFSTFALVTCIAASALAALMLSPIGRSMPERPGGAALVGGRRSLPFGVAIAVGGLWVLAHHLIVLIPSQG